MGLAWPANPPRQESLEAKRRDSSAASHSRRQRTCAGYPSGTRGGRPSGDRLVPNRPPLHGRRFRRMGRTGPHAPQACLRALLPVYRQRGRRRGPDAGCFPENLLEPGQLRPGARQPAGVDHDHDPQPAGGQLPPHTQPAGNQFAGRRLGRGGRAEAGGPADGARRLRRTRRRPRRNWQRWCRTPWRASRWSCARR